MPKRINFWNNSGKLYTFPSFLDQKENPKPSLYQLFCNLLKLSDLLSVHYELMSMLDTLYILSHRSLAKLL